ncbi:hypothetical protein PsYK624_063660 [Phanerochaete sordida]|uniref:Uncharacterized protein n=1 Tax=Phanerochaete sordida TaxID=48140 RepID=A0A9P3LDS6_9APHY|nr:hypothetical protein PsYK624_063660 [Phanerochaete sordida]
MGPVRADSAPNAMRRTAFMRGTKYGPRRPPAALHREPLDAPSDPARPSMALRADILLAIMRTLAVRGANFDRLEATSVALSYALAVPVTVVRRPGVLTCYAGERATRRRCVRIRRTHSAQVFGRIGLGTVDFGAISLPIYVVGAAVFAMVVSGVILDTSVVEAMFTFVTMMLLGAIHAFVRKAARNIIRENVFSACMMTFLTWLAHTPFASTTLASTIAGYLLLCSSFAQARRSRAPPAGVVAVFGVMYAVLLSRCLPAHMDFFFLANIWRLAAIAVPDRILHA